MHPKPTPPSLTTQVFGGDPPASSRSAPPEVPPGRGGGDAPGPGKIGNVDIPGASRGQVSPEQDDGQDAQSCSHGDPPPEEGSDSEGVTQTSLTSTPRRQSKPLPVELSQ